MNKTVNLQETAHTQTNHQPTRSDDVQAQQTPAIYQERKNPAVAILSLLLVIALGAAGYFAYMFYSSENAQKASRVPQSEPIPSPTPALMSDWEVYTSDSLGFSIKYPPDFVIEKVFDDANNRAVIFKGEEINFEVMLRENTGNIIFDEYYYMDNPVARTTTMAGLPANVYEMPNGYCDGPGCSDPSITFVVQDGSTLFHVIFIGDIEMSEKENQILSSFMLTGNDNSKKMDAGRAFGYIKSMAYSNGTYTLSFDEAEFVNDDSKPNGYYISNPSGEIVILKLVDGLVFKATTLREGGTDMIETEHTVSEFYSMFSNDNPAWIDDVPYWIVVNDNNQITSITEQFLP